MITEEQARQLKIGDTLHYLLPWNGLGCDNYKVTKPFSRWEFSDWIVEVSGWGISDTTNEIWHLPSECPHPKGD